MATYDVIATDEELEAFAETSGAPAPAAPEKKKANVIFRLLALILAACPIVLLCLLPAANLIMNGTLLDAYIYTFSNFLGFVEELATLFASGDILLGLYYVAFIALPVLLVISAILAIIALFSGKKAPALARAIAWINFWAVGGYMMAFTTILYLGGSIGSLDVFGDMTVLVPMAIAAGMALFGFILSIANSPKKVWFSTILFLLAVIFNVVIVYVLNHFATSFEGIVDNEAAWLGYVITYGQYALLGLSALALLITSGMLAKKEKFGGNLFVAIVHALLTIALLVLYLFFWTANYFPQRLVLGELTIQFSGFVACLIALGVVSVLELVISIVRLCKKAKKVKKAEKAVEETPATAAPAAAPAPVDMSNFYAEETEEEDYVEATPYTPVAVEDLYADEDEEIVEEVEEEVEEEEEEPAPAPVAAAAAPAPAPAPASDNLKLDDAFIATLTAEERQQFADIFMLKSKGDFPGVPDYKTGEDNSAFFRKIFVYLGKYRARIPDDLMGKIYDFAVNK